ncbi:MAG: M14-type cytosolic carboxypeptidase [Paludibaculum sp.]
MLLVIASTQLSAQESLSKPKPSLIAIKAGIEIPPGQPVPTRETPLAFIENAFENASPLWYSVDEAGHIQVHLLYDHEYAAPNRAALHFHFRVYGAVGSTIDLDLNNLDNVWNGLNSMVSGEARMCVISADEKTWTPLKLQQLNDNRVRISLTMNAPRMTVARVEPYTLSDLNRFLDSIRENKRVNIQTIGQTAGGRPLRDRPDRV